jgi:hypothetical protein
MTEAQWLTCTDPAPMLEFLQESGKASERKLRLFACSWCRRIWHLLDHADSRKAVDVTKRYAEGQLGRETFEGACSDAQEVMFAPHYGMAWKAAWLASWADAWAAASEVSRWAEWDWLDTRNGELTADGLLAEQAQVLRCVVGNPFRPPPSLAPPLLDWHGGAAVKLAQAIYEERSLPSGHLDAARLAVLADMLEEAGCFDAELVSHLRGPGLHVRGCVAVDAVLGQT